MTKVIHPVAGVVAIVTIASFWLATALAELLGSHAVVTLVKTTIPWGFLLLIPALMLAGGSGFALANDRRAGLIGAKIRRMPLIAANGILVLIPSALLPQRREPLSSIPCSTRYRHWNWLREPPTLRCSD